MTSDLARATAALLDFLELVDAIDDGGLDEFNATRAWLARHAQDFPGQWVALKGGRLLGHDPSRVALHRTLERDATLTGSLFVKLD